ncbi:helix-turn-helix domain-containing protein [Solobacterium moorei]|uniref:helix-turn-helix domain-containing protein n=1 Tax=Solobacterium moorei TaxID=102148 RepID=UPI001B7F91BA|nr:helix-turn-helix domain-containing protein [Solobacterium moorei]BET22001.1 hypothetical protein RGT18_15890 [Solobacterium moorei]
MRISYNKLWKMLIDKEMNRNDLKEAAGISAASIAKYFYLSNYKNQPLCSYQNAKNPRT